MFALRSCCSVVPLSLRLSPLSLGRPLSSNPTLLLFSSSASRTNPSLKMSRRPSAFDALMSGARAAAAKRKSNPEASPSNKRKSAESKPPLVTNGEKAAVDSVEPELEMEISSTGNGTADAASSDVKQCDPVECVKGEAAEEPGAKKPRAMTAEERRAELKSKIGSLKKKLADFDPRSVACWEDGERVPFLFLFLFLCLAFDMISNESGRIVITDIVCNMLRAIVKTTPDDLVAAVYLSANRVAPAHEGVEMGIGDASIIKALAEACGGKEAHIKNQYKEKGDLGLVAKESRSSQSMMRKPAALTVAKVFDTFRIIAKESGKDSQEKKKNHIKSLLVAATDCEPQYLIRLLQAKLRIGYAEQTLLAALGQAAVYTENHSKPPPHVSSPLEEAAKIVKQVYSVIPVYDKIIAALLRDGIWNLTKTCSFTIGIPVGPMLAKPTKGVSEIIEKFQNMVYTCEYKYDGERAQIHYMEDGSVEIYSRNAERNTGKYPDVAVAVSRLKKPSVTSFVLDCEIVAYDREKKRILPFQILSTRARKNVAVSDIKVDVCIYAFDILYCNGQSLIKEQLKVRRQHLYDSFEEEPGYFEFATSITSNDLEEIQNFLEASVDGSCEGLIIKTLDTDATYEPSKRSNNWLKLKKDYMDSVGDSLDLVPIGAFHGRGKRTGVYGAFLLACYDPDNEEFQSICKIGTGFSEVVLEERSASLRSKVIPKPKSYYRCGERINPDVWFEPTEVWEVKAADLTNSPAHQDAVGIVDPAKEKGDLGLVAKGSQSTQRVMYKPPPLTTDKVFNTFRNIAKESWKDSQEKKKNHIKSLLVAATDCEPQYLICLLQAKMRIGYAEQTLLAALGQAAVYTENHSKPPPHINAPLEEAAKIVKQVYSVLPVYEKVITSILTDGLWNLTMTCGITIGIPVGPMLAKPTRGVSEIIENFQGRVYTCEYKYDGQRAQIHYMEDGSIEIYSRNAERNTGRFPDVAVTVTRLKKSSVNSFILDCEIVAYDRVKNRILPFQTLSTRARKDVTLTDIKVDVCIYAFDILYCNGQSLIKEQLNFEGWYDIVGTLIIPESDLI